MRREHWIVLIAALLLLGGGGYYFYKDARYVWRAQINSANLHGEKKMLAATRLLEQHGQKVAEAETMHEALRVGLPNGTLFITNNQGFLLPAQVKQVQAWVEKGNTLIMLPSNPQKFKRKVKTEASGEDGQGKSEVDEEKEERKRLAREEQDEELINQAEPVAQNKEVVPEGGLADAPAHGERPAARQDSSNASESAEQANADVAKENSAEPEKEASADADTDTDGDAPDAASNSGSNPAKRLELDPFGKFFSVQRAYRRQQGLCKASSLNACPAQQITLPKISYPLQIAPSYMVLTSTDKSNQFELADQHAEAVRIYSLGQGQVITLAENYFDNRDLPRLDHAQLLLYVTQLGIDNKHTMFVHHLDFLPWYEALWENAKYALISLLVALALLLWMVVRRFGPLLPEAILERRALIEHIDASGRWLWHLPGGPELLLSAARTNTQQVLKRRIAEWGRLSPQEQVERLQLDSKLDPKFSAQQLWQALHEKPSAQALQFTTQVQTLQTLRKHYERK